MIFRSINKLVFGAPAAITKTVVKGTVGAMLHPVESMVHPVESMVHPVESMVHPVKSAKEKHRKNNCTITVKVKRK
jgi:hypothetical protein